MKKFAFLLVICMLILPGIYKYNAYGYEEDWEENDPFIIQEKGFRINDRAFEIGFGANVGFANSFLSADEVLKKTIVIDIDNLSDGFFLNFGFGAVPLYFSYNKDKKWGFGLSTNVDAIGVFGLSGDMLTFNEAVDEKSEIAGAVFADAGINAFFHVERFKIKIRPALYYTVAYMIPEDFTYTYSNTGNGTLLNINYNVLIYTAFPTDGLDSPDDFELTATPGFDFSVGVEYPLAKALGLKNRYQILDFDVGLDLLNIPIVKSKMKHYMKLSGGVGDDKPLDIFGENGGFNMDMDGDPVYGKKEIEVFRPFIMLAWAQWRPLGSELLTIIPSAGLAVNPLYLEPVSFEGGLSVRLDIANLFITTLGINHTDRLWKNSIDIALNFRAFELNLGIDMRAPDFVDSWSGNGTGFNIGMKFGW
jgi:hypothetical protein